MKEKLSEQNAALHGRYLKTEKGICFDWTGSGFSFCFRGTASLIQKIKEVMGWEQL